MADILVTLPAYNEEKVIGSVIEEIKQALRGQDYFVLVVSDGSTDGTKKEAEKAGAIVFTKEHGGLADTFKYEMRIACRMKPGVIVHIDADGQFAPCDIMRLVKRVWGGNDLVLGNRLNGDIKYMAWDRIVLNKLCALGLRIWSGQDIRDVATGFRAFTVDVAALQIKGAYSFTVEQLIRASRAGYKIKSVPVEFRNRKDGQSKQASSTARYLWKTLLNIRRMVQ